LLVDDKSPKHSAKLRRPTDKDQFEGQRGWGDLGYGLGNSEGAGIVDALASGLAIDHSSVKCRAICGNQSSKTLAAASIGQKHLTLEAA
jgi:hypothetical protein